MTTNWHDRRNRLLRYIGGKIRIVPTIVNTIRRTGGRVLVDVFGGSGAVVSNCGFDKKVYNDLDSSLVAFFRCIRDDSLRGRLVSRLMAQPCSRELFVEHKARLDSSEDILEVAESVFYVSSFCYGGKISSGGFAATVSDRVGCKEIKRYYSVLAGMEEVASVWKDIVIENLPYARMIENYSRPGVVFYCDPPYVGTETHYTAGAFCEEDHRTLARMLVESGRAAVVSYYDHPLIRELYPVSDGWTWHSLLGTKNSMHKGPRKEATTELLIWKR